MQTAFDLLRLEGISEKKEGLRRPVLKNGTKLFNGMFLGYSL